jgi:glutamate racemase
MNDAEAPVLFLDSGAGGLPYCGDFHRRCPTVPLVYVADRENFPYGPKDRETLTGLLSALVARLVETFRPQVLALACNTASVSALEALRRAFPALPLVGTVPAVKPAAAASRKGRVGVLGTSRTVEDPYIARLAERYGGGCSLSALAAPELVDFVERRFEEADGAERLEAVRPSVDFFRAEGADALVLGCTHFLFLTEEFRRAAGPDMGVFDSVEGVSRRIDSLLAPAGGGGVVPPHSGEALGPNLLVLTGNWEPEPVWYTRAERFGLSLRLLDSAQGIAAIRQSRIASEFCPSAKLHAEKHEALERKARSPGPEGRGMRPENPEGWAQDG